MANKKSSKKDILHTAKRRLRNQNRMSRMKTYLKKADTALADESLDKEAKTEAVRVALAEIDRTWAKGMIHKNAAGRKKSSLQRRMAAL